jgi:hypothetical protein
MTWKSQLTTLVLSMRICSDRWLRLIYATLVWPFLVIDQGSNLNMPVFDIGLYLGLLLNTAKDSITQHAYIDVLPDVTALKRKLIFFCDLKWLLSSEHRCTCNFYLEACWKRTFTWNWSQICSINFDEACIISNRGTWAKSKVHRDWFPGTRLQYWIRLNIHLNITLWRWETRRKK